MIWVTFIMWRVAWALVGAFALAYIHEQKGRDVQMGGLLGLAIGAVFGIVGVIFVCVWVYYSAGAPVGRVYNAKRRWYNWWG